MGLTKEFLEKFEYDPEKVDKGINSALKDMEKLKQSIQKHVNSIIECSITNFSKQRFMDILQCLESEIIVENGKYIFEGDRHIYEYSDDDGFTFRKKKPVKYIEIKGVVQL